VRAAAAAGARPRRTGAGAVLCIRGPQVMLAAAIGGGGGGRISGAVLGAAAVGVLLTLPRLPTTLRLLPAIFRSCADGGTVPSTEAGNVRTAVLVGTLWAGDKFVARLLRALGLGAFPSSIVSLMLVFGGLVSTELSAGRRVAERAAEAFQPGVDFLGRWMVTAALPSSTVAPPVLCLQLAVMCVLLGPAR
jgi:hypothetical protein